MLPVGQLLSWDDGSTTQPAHFVETSSPTLKGLALLYNCPRPPNPVGFECLVWFHATSEFLGPESIGSNWIEMD